MVSVIVPVYNVEKYLPACIESILSQDYKDLEVFLVDDGSTDNSGSICDAYAKKDPRITVIHQTNQGLSAARNAALNADRRGEYIAFVDSDDYIAPNYISCLLSALQNSPDADIALCRFFNCYEQDDGTYLPTPCRSHADKELLTRDEALLKRFATPNVYYILAWNKLYKRELFDTLRYPVGKNCEDSWISLELFLKCKQIVCINEPLYYYRLRTSSISHDTSGKWIGAQLDCMRRDVLYYVENDISHLEYPAKPFVSLAYKKRRLLSDTDRKANSYAWNISIKCLLTSGGFIQRLKYLFYYMTYKY